MEGRDAHGSAAITVQSFLTSMSEGFSSAVFAGGALMWFLMLQSVVHATVAGVMLAFAIPYSSRDDADLRDGRLERMTVKWPAVFRATLKLSGQQAAKTGTRSVDILHIASAKALRMKELATFDSRQRALAAAAGLTEAVSRRRRTPAAAPPRPSRCLDV